MKSTFLGINWTDLGNAALMIALVTVITGLLPTFDSGSFPTGAELVAAGKAGLTTGVAYILKNFLTNSQGKFLNTEK